MTRFHIGVSLNALVKMDRMCLGLLRMLRPELANESDEYICAQAAIRRARGMTVWPCTCNTPRRDGHCPGHRLN